MKVGDLIRETHKWTPLGDLVKTKNESTCLVLKPRQDIEDGAFVVQCLKSGIKHILRPRSFDAQCYEVVK